MVEVPDRETKAIAGEVGLEGDDIRISMTASLRSFVRGASAVSASDAGLGGLRGSKDAFETAQAEVMTGGEPTADPA